MKLQRNFYDRSTLIVARELLGKFLCRKADGKVIRVRITETEAYCGIKDKACHASKGLTPRTKTMFGPPGHAYIYMIYGMYYCLNFVTEAEGNPSAVLIRGVEGISGPGKLCRDLKIDRSLNSADICNGRELWVEDAEPVRKIYKSKRIGVHYAGKWKDKLWRFYTAD